MIVSDKEYVLENQVAVVTGAGRGIGKAIAIGYAAAGAAVCCAARTASEIEATAGEIARAGGRAIAVPTDVTDLTAVERMFEATFEAFGGVDILVINAGVNYDHRSVEESRPEDWLRTVDVNLTGAYYCAHAVIPYLKRRGGGKIITVGSGLGHRGRPDGAAYACSKAGLWMLTRVLAQELNGDAISVNELIPGPVHTTMTSGGRIADAPRFQAEWHKEPEDVVPLALFLATQPNDGPSAQSYSLMRRDT
jgi:3-oxoacyl-[acyl-carrier protein] reductase